ncbi:unnamed protein product [Hymenolepis diminuta]|uniref:Uncharacterized protein n=1 Tax=Hymenolepis diminuta TaxID=6216 RepID=A0A564YMF1_HYMDI|nr:unnamed protein product [Hymenolepis diminuta]VUZ53550.1 unnamed protein product [Hymenolepis diminuta]
MHDRWYFLPFLSFSHSQTWASNRSRRDFCCNYGSGNDEAPLSSQHNLAIEKGKEEITCGIIWRMTVRSKMCMRCAVGIFKRPCHRRISKNNGA